MVLKASAPGNDRAKTEKCRYRGRNGTNKVSMWLPTNDAVNYLPDEKAGSPCECLQQLVKRDCRSVKCAFQIQIRLSLCST